MDDIRRPNNQRRDFAMRHRAHRLPGTPPAGQPPAPQSDLAQPPQPPAQQPAEYYQPAPLPASPQIDYDQDMGFAPEAAGIDDYSHPIPQARPQPAAKKRRLPKIPVKHAAILAVVVIVIGAGLYLLTRPPKKSGFTVAQLSQKSTFGFYYPQPLPSGYDYVTKINAFENGQAYFMLANGSKHLIFKEQADSGRLDTSNISHPQMINTSAGKAAIGTEAGQPAAKVLAGSTLISINTTGSVPEADLSQAVNSLKTDR